MSSMRRSVSNYRTVDGVADPSPDVGQWRRSLRNINPDESPRKLTYSGDLLQSREMTQGNSKPAANEPNASEAAALRDKYINSLQQRIYLLEVENGHLRSQSAKATGMQSSMSADTERMLQELKSLESKVETLQLENILKDDAVEQLQRRILKLTSSLTELADTRPSDGKSEGQGIEELLLERDALQRRVAQLRAHIGEAEGVGPLDGDLRTAENRVRNLKDQLAHALDKLARADAAISSERDAVARLDDEVRRLERRLAVDRRRDDIIIIDPGEREATRRLRRRRRLEAGVRPEELRALAKRNAALEAALERLQMELLLRTRPPEGRQEDEEAAAIAAARRRERERQLEEQAARGAQEAAELRQRLRTVELEDDGGSVGGVTELARQCQRLQRDNAQLSNSVRSLEAALERQQAERAAARAAVDSSEARMSEMQMELSKLQELQASRWSEVEKIATTIGSAAKTNSELFYRP